MIKGWGQLAAHRCDAGRDVNKSHGDRVNLSLVSGVVALPQGSSVGTSSDLTLRLSVPGEPRILGIPAIWISQLFLLS